MQIPHGQIQFGNVGVNVWTCPAVGTWQWECSQPWAGGVMEALLPLPATVLPGTAEPLLELALLCRGRGCI